MNAMRNCRGCICYGCPYQDYCYDNYCDESGKDRDCYKRHCNSNELIEGDLRAIVPVEWLKSAVQANYDYPEQDDDFIRGMKKAREYVKDWGCNDGR
jgi:hypothetical protein